MISFVLAHTDHGSMIVNRLDYNESNSGLYGVGHQLLKNGCYDPVEVQTLRSILISRHRKFGRGIVAIDAGANLGVHTLEWARLMRGWGSVIAIEAQERIFYALAGNIALQNCANVRAIWAAVSDVCGKMKIAEPDYWQPASFGSLELRERPGVEYIGQCIDYDEPNLKVRTITIDSLELPRVDLIKMDVEGMEMEALKGAQDTIRRCRPALCVEVAKSNEGAIRDFLQSEGYEPTKIGMNLLA